MQNCLQTYLLEDGYRQEMDDKDGLPSVDLTDEERRKLESLPALSAYRREKLEKDSKKNWDLFYKRNGNRFFKNRYWTKHEFQELFEVEQTRSDEVKYLLEIGCGCGDFILPLIEDTQDSANCTDRTRPTNLFIYCCDISNQAIELLKSNPAYKRNNPTKIEAFVADITKPEEVFSPMDGRLMDIVSIVFVLSAIDPDRMQMAVANINKVLRPGGLVLFRDYAIYDKAMLRFSEQSKIADQFYTRQDGTRAYFFTKRQLVRLFTNCNFQCQSIDYVKRETVNIATKDKFSRIFLQAKFMKLDGKNLPR